MIAPVESRPSRSARAWPRQPRGVSGRLALPQRVVEEAEEGDADHVGKPAAQFGIEQVQVAPIVEEGERRQRHQRRGRQHRAEREGEPGAAEVLPHQTGVEQAADAGRNDQQRHRNRNRKADPAHSRGASRSGSRRSALPLTPKLPSAPSRAKTVASRPATRSMSSTLARSLPTKKETEDVSASLASTPTAGARVAVMPLTRPDSTRPAVGALLRTHVLRLVADDDDAVERTEVAARAREEVAADRLQQGPAQHQLTTDPDPEGSLAIGVAGQIGEAGLVEIAGEGAGVDRLAHDPHRDQARPGRLERVLDRVEHVLRQVAESDERRSAGRATGRARAPG